MGLYVKCYCFYNDLETLYIGHSTEFSIGYFGGGGGSGMGDNLPPFSIELLSFSGYNDNVSNRLFWTTEMELNGDKFKVERSTENGNFEEIGEVKAIGNSNKHENYAFNDTKFKANRNFYRLKMLDKDGSLPILMQLNLQRIIWILPFIRILPKTSFLFREILRQMRK